MSKNPIQLIEFAASRYGLEISPMLASFVPIENEVTAFDAHRHDYYGLFLLTSGEMTMLVQEKEVIMKGSSLLLVQPGQVHRCVCTHQICGWVMFVDAKIVDTKTRTVTEQLVEEVVLFELDQEQQRFTDQLFLAVFQAYDNQTPGPFQMQMLHALTNALFYQAASLQLLRRSLDENTSSRPAQIVQEFRCLIKQHFKRLKRPAAYAELLHLSVSHLNDTVKAFTGYSATNLLQQELMGDAQKELRYTSRSIKEIAFGMGYSDYKYFIRLFTKVTGQSPTAFRKNTKSVLRDRNTALVSKAY